jgi:hypothetical protein
MVGFAGVMRIETKEVPVTVRVVEPDTEPSVAVIVVGPVPTVVARPLLPEPLLIDATEELLDCHVTAEVRF